MSNRVLVVGVLVSVVAMASAYAQSRPAQYVLSADAVKFTPVDPKSPDGVAMSVVSGELQGKGPITLLLRLPKGPAPLHTHTRATTPLSCVARRSIGRLALKRRRKPSVLAVTGISQARPRTATSAWRTSASC